MKYQYISINECKYCLHMYMKNIKTYCLDAFYNMLIILFNIVQNSNKTTGTRTTRTTLYIQNSGCMHSSTRMQHYSDLSEIRIKWFPN